MMDTVLRGGAIVDGTGAPSFRADVGISHGVVVSIGNLAAVEADQVIDASGLIVAPGFIDIHSHSDFTLLVDPRAQSSIVQGVTTEVIGNCGHGCAPITDPELFEGNIYGYDPRLDIDWRTTSEYFDRLDSARPAVNIVPLVPNGNLRIAVDRSEHRAGTPERMVQMIELLEEGLDAGAFGYSTGLEYPSERQCTEEEISELCRVVARVDGLYATHTRNKEVRAVEAIEEAVRTAEAAGVRLQVSHIIPRRGGPDDALDRAIGVVEDARDRGMDIAFDAHTRLHGITNLSAGLPPWAFEGGPDDLASRLRHTKTREKMKEYHSIITSFGLGGWDKVFLFQSGGSPHLQGKSLQELIPDGGDAYDVLFDLLLSECDAPHESLCLCLSYEEDQLRQAFGHPLCTIGSDATALAVDGPLAGTVFLGAFTWASWFYRRFVNELSVFTLEQAVRKLSRLPADRLGLSDRGRIVEGAKADIIVFDPATFREHGTLEAPSQLAQGMSHVIVNGVSTLKHGSMTGNRNGRVIRRQEFGR